jgi:uncharacterized membrane protein YgcG
MYEEFQRKRTNLHSASRTTAAPRRAGKFGYTGLQITVCLACIIAAVFIRLAGGSFYTLVRNTVSNALDTPVTSSNVSQVFAAIKSGFPDYSTVFSSSSTKADSGKSSSGSSSSSAGSSSSSSNTSGTSSAATKSSAPAA